MIVETLIVKGLVVLGHMAATHLTAGGAAALIHTAAGMSLSQLATATITAGFVTGCITWTGDRIKNVQNGVKAINEGRTFTAIKEFGQFALSAGVDVDLLPDTIESGLERMHLDSNASKEVTSWVKSHKIEIANYVRNHK